MAVTEIEFIDDGGNVRLEEISTSSFAVRLDGTLYEPAVTEEVEIENDGETTNPQDQCGNAERVRSGNRGWTIRVTGIITANEVRRGNLSLELLKQIATMNEITIRTDVLSGSFVVRNTVITESSDLVSIQTGDTDGPEQAFDFQLQLGEEQSDS